VLGDITNATNEDSKIDGSKKANIFSGITQMQAAPVEVMSNTNDDEHMTTDSDDRFYMQRPSDDIDARDEGNPLHCTAYINQMYDIFSLIEKEKKVNHEYMANQPYVNDRMRSILVDWLVEVHLKFKMVPETLYLTVNLIDRYLELKQVRRSKLQLVGVSALLLASKYEEIYPPELRDLVYITDRAYNKQEILEMESDIVNTLHYNLTVPTVHSFLCRYLKAAHADRTLVQLACYIAERSLQEFSMVKYLPSQIAATAVLIARKSHSRHAWSPTLLKYSKYDEKELAQCAEEMRVYMSDNSQQQAIKRKYSSTKFGGVGNMALTF
jgi:cyclin B